MYDEEKDNLRRFSKHIVQVLRPSFISVFLSEYLDDESVERILSEEKSSVTHAAEMLIDKMLRLEEVGWFQAFLDTLLASEYSGLHAAVSDWNFTELEDLQECRILLDRIEPSITKNMKPRELLPHLSDCLRHRECEEIKAVNEQFGCIAASVRLVQSLRRSDKQWFKMLKNALYNCNQKPALQLLEPDESEKKCVSEECEENMGTISSVRFEYMEDGDNGEDLVKSINEISVSDLASVEAAGVGRSVQKKLRKYQIELAEAALSGQNTIICAPTGCGKTIVALEICENHLKKFPGKAKVVFMATKVEVYAQQFKLFIDHFSKDPAIRVTGVCGDTDVNVCMRSVVDRNEVVVLTPQILVNALQNKELPSLDVFTLLLLDECHNTTGKHPYNNIMNRYLDIKLKKSTHTLPQVVGFTASVGIGSFKNQQEAEINICHLCANLDTRVIATVSKNIEELRSYVNIPEKEFFEVPTSPISDPFIRIIRNIMCNIEQLAKNIYDIDVANFLQSQFLWALNLYEAFRMAEHGQATPFKPCITKHKTDTLSPIVNRDYGSQKYEQWIVDVQKRCKLLQQERNVCRALFNYTEHLRKYNDALIINEDARTKDALDYLQAFIEQVRMAGNDKTERTLIAFFDVQREQLLRLATEGQDNPKLQELKFILEEEYRNNDQTRTVLFVRTRALTDALKKWIDETDSLKFLNPGVLIGRRRNSQLVGTGMTLTSQKGVLDSFKTSDHIKILIATSVADEGIDIPQCNLVLMYEYVGNVVKMVQVRGRGRAVGSRCFLISSRTERIEKEKQNMEREKIVEKAIFSLQASPEKLQAKVEYFQREDKAMREFENRSPEKPRTVGSYKLLCAKCNAFACASDDLRVLKDCHHVILDRLVFNRCVTPPHHNPKSFGGITKTQKMLCAECKLDWGIVATYLHIKDLPIVKIESFVVQDVVTQKKQFFRRWREVTFAMREFELTEITPETWGPRE